MTSSARQAKAEELRKRRILKEKSGRLLRLQYRCFWVGRLGHVYREYTQIYVATDIGLRKQSAQECVGCGRLRKRFV